MADFDGHPVVLAAKLDMVLYLKLKNQLPWTRILIPIQLPFALPPLPPLPAQLPLARPLRKLNFL